MPIVGDPLQVDRETVPVALSPSDRPSGDAVDRRRGASDWPPADVRERVRRPGMFVVAMVAIPAMTRVVPVGLAVVEVPAVIGVKRLTGTSAVVEENHG